jgi:hypothetical protein
MLDRIKISIGGSVFSPRPPVSSTNKIDCHDITEILLKVAVNTIKQTNQHQLEETVQRSQYGSTKYQ